MATDSENQAELDAARERQNEKQRAFRASFRSVDESTKITVTDLGKQEIPRLPQIHGNGNPFKRNLNYIDLLSSPTVASHREACSGAGRITGHQDLRTAERRGWVILEGL